MKSYNILVILTIFGGLCRLGQPTCVLESDFGFTLNCAFKKSGLFRVRNLGGVKAHIGLGFTLGDELGFKESISNVEINRRRSSQASKLQAQLIQASQQKAKAENFRMRSASGLKNNDGGMMIMKKSPSMVPTIPPFKPIPPATGGDSTSSNSSLSSGIPQPTMIGIALPVPSSSSSSSKLTSLPKEPSKPKVMAVIVPKPTAMDKLSSTNFALRTLPSSPTTNNEVAHNILNFNTNNNNNNYTDDLLHAALLQRHLAKMKISSLPPVATTTTMKTTTTTSTTPRSSFSKFDNSVGKVMNAPKEYYPVGYDKNFDDNFASRVELPETSFFCGDQKHFPGLYADEDLGCMVFHVCALTDDGLIMKSFLCPESTLFDQTILKCNWWFYVDCKNSKKLYDSNIPISKSYQLMKALTFFSTYKKDSPSSSSSSSFQSNDKD